MADIFDEIGTQQNQGGDIFDQVGAGQGPSLVNKPGSPEDLMDLATNPGRAFELMTGLGNAPVSPEPSTFGRTLRNVFATIGRAEEDTARAVTEGGMRAPFEVAAGLTQPIVTYPVGKIAGGAGAIRGMITGEKGLPGQYEAAAHELLDIQPTTEVAQDVLKPIGQAMEVVTYPARKLGEAVKYGGIPALNIPPGSDVAAWVTQTLGELATFAAIPKLPKMIKDSSFYRTMTIPQRGLALQSLGDAMKANPGMTEGQILRKWNNPTWQEEALGKRSVGERPGVQPAPEETTFRMPGEPQGGLPEPVDQFRTRGPNIGTVAGENLPFSPELAQKMNIPPGLPPGQGFISPAPPRREFFPAEGPPQEPNVTEQAGPFYPPTIQGPPPGPPPEGMGLTVETGPPPPALSTIAGEAPTSSPAAPPIQGMQPVTNPDLVTQLEGERRVNQALRQRVDQMTPEEMQKELLTDHLTGLPNKRALQEAEPGAFKGVADVDNLKWINDNFGHQAGDELLKTVGKALADQTDQTFSAFHISGDEFVVQANNAADIETRLAKATEALKNTSLKYTAPDGTIHELKGIGLSYGKGEDLATAEKGLQENKKAREISGERAGRGEKPARVVQIPAQGGEVGGKAKQPWLKAKTQPKTFYHVSSAPIKEWKSGQEISLSDRPLTKDFGNHVYKTQVELKRPAPDVEAYRKDVAQGTNKYDGVIWDGEDYQGKPIKLAKVKDASQLKNIEYKKEPAKIPPMSLKKGPGEISAEIPQEPGSGNQVYRSRGLEDAKLMRQEEPEGSLANYDNQSKGEWLRGQIPPKDGKLTLYRATPTGEEIKPGDYVTNSLQYAKDHIKNNLGGKGKVTSLKATLDDIYPADGPGEFWYAPKSITGEIPPKDASLPVGGIDFELYTPKKFEDAFYNDKMGKKGGFRINDNNTTQWAIYNPKGELKSHDPDVSVENLERWNSAIQKAINSKLNDLPNNIYIRYGNVPKGKISADYSSNTKEKGLSVYNAKKDLLTDTVWPDLRDGSLPAAAIVRGVEGAPIYLVKGTRAGKGKDGEPVIRNIEIISRLRLHPDANVEGFILEDLPNRSTPPGDIPPKETSLPAGGIKEINWEEKKLRDYEEGRLGRIAEDDEYRLSNISKEEMDVYKKSNPQLKDNPKTVTIYRATKGDQIQPGDWVYLRKDLANKHLENRTDSKVISSKVSIDDIVTASDDVEFVYSPKTLPNRSTPPGEGGEVVSKHAAKPTETPSKVSLLSRRAEIKAKENFSKYEKQVSDSAADYFKVGETKVFKVSELEIPKGMEIPKGRDIHGTNNGKAIFIKKGLNEDQFNYALEHELEHLQKKENISWKEEYPGMAKDATSGKAVSPEFGGTETPKDDLTYLHAGLSPQEALKNLREHIPITKEHEVLFERLYSNPWYMAKKHPEAKGTVDVQLRRDENRRQFYSGTLRKAEPFFELKGKDLDALEKKIIEWDAQGKDISGDPTALAASGLNPQQIEAYKAVRKVLNQVNDDFRTTLIDAQLVKYRNEPFYQGLKKFAHEKEMPTDSKILNDPGFVDAMMKLTQPLAKINELRNEMGKIKGYFPRERDPGNYAVSAKDAKGNLVSYEQTKTIAGAKALIEKHQKAGLTATYKEVTKTPESVFQGIDAISLDRFLSQAIDKIKASGTGSAALADELQSAVLDAMVESLKARGWTKHGIERNATVIKGYKETDLQSVLNQYLAGYAGWKTKYIASYEFAEELAKLNKSNPQVFDYFSKYAKDALRNSETIDQVAGKVRGIAFTYYLMGNLKQVALQMTQGLTTVLPQARKIKTFPEKDLLKAQVDVATGKGMTPEEAKMMQVAKDKGIIDDPYVQEVTARTEGGMSPAMRKAAQILNLPISGMEKYNRAYTMLASYRWFRAKGQGTAEAFKSARDFVQDVHWLYGKANLPEFARGESPMARSVGRAAYTFVPWAHNYLLSLKEGWQRGGAKGHIASLESLAWMALLAGPLALPFLGDLADLAEKLTGRPLRKDAIAFLKDKTGAMSPFFTHGLAGLMGTDISGSMKIGLPGYSLLSGKDKDLGESLFGVFTSIGKGLGRGAALMSDKDFSRAIEEMSPTFLKNLQTAFREYTQGRTTWKGKPIFDFSGEKPTQDRATLREAALKAVGFNPQRRGESNLKYQSYANMIKIAQDKKDNLVDRFVKYFLDDNSTGKEKVIEELRAFNTEMRDKGMPEFQIGNEFKSKVRMRLQPGKKATQFYRD